MVNDLGNGENPPPTGKPDDSCQSLCFGFVWLTERRDYEKAFNWR